MAGGRILVWRGVKCLQRPDRLLIRHGSYEMFRFLRRWWQKQRQTATDGRTRLLAKYPDHVALIDSREIPHSYERGPDLSYYTESARFYYDLICESAPHLKDRPRAATDADREMASVANNRIVHATWGLIARGAEAMPFAIKLIASKDRDLRESGANVVAGLHDPARLPDVVRHTMAALETEQDRLVIDTLLSALGDLRSPQAIPLLKRFIVNDQEDGDTRWEAAVSLGKIVGKRFDRKGADAVELAQQWLAEYAAAEP